MKLLYDWFHPQIWNGVIAFVHSAVLFNPFIFWWLFTALKNSSDEMGLITSIVVVHLHMAVTNVCSMPELSANKDCLSCRCFWSNVIFVWSLLFFSPLQAVLKEISYMDKKWTCYKCLCLVDNFYYSKMTIFCVWTMLLSNFFFLRAMVQYIQLWKINIKLNWALLVGILLLTLQIKHAYTSVEDALQ